jgi:hypothetical protein
MKNLSQDRQCHDGHHNLTPPEHHSSQFGWWLKCFHQCNANILLLLLLLLLLMLQFMKSHNYPLESTTNIQCPNFSLKLEMWAVFTLIQITHYSHKCNPECLTSKITLDPVKRLSHQVLKMLCEAVSFNTILIFNIQQSWKVWKKTAHTDDIYLKINYGLQVKWEPLQPRWFEGNIIDLRYYISTKSITRILTSLSSSFQSVNLVFQMKFKLWK